MQYIDKKMMAIETIKKTIINNSGKNISFYELLEIIESNYGLGGTFLKNQLKKYTELKYCNYNEIVGTIECI